MQIFRRVLPSLLILFISSHSWAVTELDCYQYEGCLVGAGSRSGQASANPSFGNQIRINPSAVPTEKGVGLEGILYRDEVDFSIVQGLGRVGAAISPSNSEETFFGPPGFELDNQLLERKQSNEKYPRQKYTFATAINLYRKMSGTLSNRSLQLGAMGRYNMNTKNVSPGAGLNGILGPFIFGGSIYDDQTRIEDTSIVPEQRTIYKYQVRTYSLGVSLNSLMLDYSVLRSEVPDSTNISTVKIATASLLVKRFIFTYSKRSEESERKSYNYLTRQLEVAKIKEDFFAGVQYNLAKDFMIGGLYNYYLLHEYTLTATYFF